MCPSTQQIITVLYGHGLSQLQDQSKKKKKKPDWTVNEIILCAQQYIFPIQEKPWHADSLQL